MGFWVEAAFRLGSKDFSSLGGGREFQKEGKAHLKDPRKEHVNLKSDPGAILARGLGQVSSPLWIFRFPS